MKQSIRLLGAACGGPNFFATALFALLALVWAAPARAGQWTFDWNSAQTTSGGVWPTGTLAPVTRCYSSTAPVNSGQSFYNSGYDIRVSLTRSGTSISTSASVSTVNSEYEQYMDGGLTGYGNLLVEFKAVSSRTGYTGGNTGTPCSGANKPAYVKNVSIADIDRVSGGVGSYYRDQIRVTGNGGTISPTDVTSIGPTRTVTAANTGTNVMTASSSASLYVGMVVGFISGTPPAAFTLSTPGAVTYYCVTYASGTTFSLGLPSGTPPSCAGATTLPIGSATTGAAFFVQSWMPGTSTSNCTGGGCTTTNTVRATLDLNQNMRVVAPTEVNYSSAAFYFDKHQDRKSVV